MQQGIIFNVQRYTIHDGPGIRTEIFMKGCPLSCKWCGNPESRDFDIQPGVYASRCVGKERCGLCLGACGQENGLLFGNVDPEESNRQLSAIDRTLCIGCMKCSDVCPADAIRAWGRRMTTEEVMELIRRDRSYYESSGGGVTVSGGEPLVQADFTEDVLKQCRSEGIHTCLESTFCMDWDIIRRVVPHADMLITDIKHMDAAVHRKYTGVSNERILENLQKLVYLGKPVIIRIPVVPGINDDRANMEDTADFIRDELGGNIHQLQLLPFMRLGEEKYKSLGMPYPMEGLDFDRAAFQLYVQETAAYFNRRGIHCTVGTKEKI